MGSECSEGKEERGGSAGPRTYSNDLAVGFRLSEVELRFGQRFGAEALHVQCRIVTSPTHLVTFGRVIADTIAAYESRFGVIPAPPDARTDEGGA